MHIAIIAARGGSKRIPRKNIRPFLGKPMIAWPIEAAKASGCFEHILVTTDDAEIAEVSREYGAEVPFMRPPELADDFVHADAAVKHALRWALEAWGNIEAFCHLYPTAPAVQPEHIQKGQQLIIQGATQAPGIFAITFPVYQILQKEGEMVKNLFDKKKAAMRSQDMPAFFIDAGQMYWFNTQDFLGRGGAVNSGTRLVELPRHAAIDIDTEEDWLIAEKLCAAFRPENQNGRS